MAAKPKVYFTRIGLRDTVVAAPSQKAALAHAGVALRRPAGTDQPLKEAPDRPPSPKGGPPTAGKPPPKPKLAPDRRPLEAAEQALAALEAEAQAQARQMATRRKLPKWERERALRVYQREGETR